MVEVQRTLDTMTGKDEELDEKAELQKKKPHKLNSDSTIPTKETIKRSG